MDSCHLPVSSWGAPEPSLKPLPLGSLFAKYTKAISPSRALRVSFHHSSIHKAKTHWAISVLIRCVPELSMASASREAPPSCPPPAPPYHLSYLILKAPKPSLDAPVALTLIPISRTLLSANHCHCGAPTPTPMSLDGSSYGLHSLLTSSSGESEPLSCFPESSPATDSPPSNSSHK